MGDSHPDKDRSTTGFAGLSSQVSEVDDTISKAEQLRSRKPVESKPQNDSAGGTSSFDSSAYSTPIQTGNGSKLGWWIAALVVGGVIWAANQSSEQSSTPVEPESFSETTPSIAAGQTLTGDELRYCLAEKVRMDAAEGFVNGYDWPQVEQFNAMVADYNARCGEFRYRPGAMSRAQDDVDAHRLELEEEGRDRMKEAAR